MILSNSFSRDNHPGPSPRIAEGHPLAAGLGYMYYFPCSGRWVRSLRENDTSLHYPLSFEGDGGTEDVGGLLVNDGGLNYPRMHFGNFTDTLSFAALVTVNSKTGDYGAIISKRNDATGRPSWWFSYTLDSGSPIMNVAWLDSNGNFSQVKFDTDPPLGTHLYGFTYEASSVGEEWKCWIDGELVATVSESDKPPFTADSIYANLGVLYPGATTYLTAVYHGVWQWIYQVLDQASWRELWNNPWAMMEPDPGEVWPGYVPPASSVVPQIVQQMYGAVA